YRASGQKAAPGRAQLRPGYCVHLDAGIRQPGRQLLQSTELLGLTVRGGHPPAVSGTRPPRPTAERAFAAWTFESPKRETKIHVMLNRCPFVKSPQARRPQIAMLVSGGIRSVAD